MKGFDAAFDTVNYLPKFKNEVDFVARYYSFNPAKDLTLEEAEVLSHAGLSIVTVWEAFNNAPKYFSSLYGKRDAAKALAAAKAIGQPKDSAIYFAVDFDPTAVEIRNFIIPYFQSVKDLLQSQYSPGVYGSGLVCKTLKALGLSHYSWLAAARWTESSSFLDYNILQHLPGDPYGFGIPIDLDSTKNNLFGQWSLAQPNVPATVIPSCADLQIALKDLGFYTGIVDGLMGPLTYHALRTYYRQ